MCKDKSEVIAQLHLSGVQYVVTLDTSGDVELTTDTGGSMSIHECELLIAALSVAQNLSLERASQ